MVMTQKQLIKEYIKEFGSILPAKLSGVVYKGVMFGSETSKRCRELRQAGELRGEPDGKFERFFAKPTFNLKAWNAQFRPVKQSLEQAKLF